MEDNYDISALKKKKRKNSRAKGSTFERQIAKLFNDRFNTTEFSRSPGSGAFATTHDLPDYLKIYGDLITPQNFNYCIECKKGYNKENLYSLYNYSSDLWGFLDQCLKDSEKCDKIPMVIFKQDRQPTLAIVPSHVQTNKLQQYIEIQKQEDAFNLRVYRIYKLDDLLEDYDSLWFN
jgi:Holliday junction resolvase|tara:strand:+ start:3067 stop:3597 length:531 start_codon:yes stop_codon:yes gene_type:complete